MGNSKIVCEDFLSTWREWGERILNRIPISCYDQFWNTLQFVKILVDGKWHGSDHIQVYNSYMNEMVDARIYTFVEALNRCNICTEFCCEYGDSPDNFQVIMQDVYAGNFRSILGRLKLDYGYADLEGGKEFLVKHRDMFTILKELLTDCERWGDEESDNPGRVLDFPRIRE